MGIIKQENLPDSYEGKSTLISRNITVCGRRTSVRLEPEMWLAMREIAKREECSIHEICTLIQVRKNAHTSLTAAIRVFIMLYFRAATTEDGHVRAGHGNFDHMKARARVPSEYDGFFKQRRQDSGASSAAAPVVRMRGGWGDDAQNLGNVVQI